MPKIAFSGPLSLRLRSFWTLNRIALTTYARHAMGRRLTPDWDANLEIGIRFWRHQFTTAMRMPDIARGRLLFDSVVTETDDVYDVTTRPMQTPRGTWITPRTLHCDTTVLHLHGGGYTFHGAVSTRFAQMLSHRTGARVFAPDYRLTPEHPHPAQIDDALAAWHYLADQTDPSQIVVTGDSAGGHLALMLLQTLKATGAPQPALCIGMCPWTDIGPRGASLTAHDKYDLVQGWMALQFGTWLDPQGRFGRAALSPMDHDFAGLAPLYLQAGGREILRDMIRDFAVRQTELGADVRLDVWPDMPHDFQAYDTLKSSSRAAIAKLSEAVQTRAIPASSGAAET